MTPRRVVVSAPAKVNLALLIGEERPDGYHDVETLMLALDLCDRVDARRSEGSPAGGEIRLAVCGPAAAGVPADEHNLVWRAARAALERARASSGAMAGLEIVLEKRIPSAAGLGGGSSDAAAALLASATVLGLDPGDPELGDALARLGSDCAFFYEARATGLARCTGRGDEVEVLVDRSFPWVVAVVTPGFGCSTAEVYRARRELARHQRAAAVARAPGTLDPGRFNSGSLAEARAALVNELEPAALRASAELRAFREILEGLEPGAFHLAGSGSSFFALFDGVPDAERALRRVRSAAEGRRCALRGSWALRARAEGVRAEASSSQLPYPGCA